jgi:tetratricopeptide (TPR) repeat protein
MQSDIWEAFSRQPRINAEAESNCQKALELYRDIGDQLGEAHALNYLGSLQCAIGMHEASASTLAQALRLYRTLGHRLGQAEVFNSLGDLRMREIQGQDRTPYEQALAIAQELGARLEEAHALEGIGNDNIENGNIEDGAIFLRRSLEIYRRIGCVHADRVDKTLHLHRL